MWARHCPKGWELSAEQIKCGVCYRPWKPMSLCKIKKCSFSGTCSPVGAKLGQKNAPICKVKSTCV